MASNKNRKKDKLPGSKASLDQNTKLGNYKRNVKTSKTSRLRTAFIIIIAIGCGLVHRYHVSTLFENDRHFSHLSTLEREMTFRSEMGLYYSYYKTLAEGESFSSGLESIVRDNLTEYPSTINTLERFNLLPEVLLAALFRAYDGACSRLGVEPSECWQVERGGGAPPVLSCEGLRQPEYFYLEGVWTSAAVTAALLFLYGLLLSESIIGGVITVLCFFYNHGESTRVQWTPPLRESFAYPFCLLHMYCVSWVIKSNVSLTHTAPTMLKHKFQLAAVVTTTCLSLLLWQFSQFFLATQVLALLIMFAFGFLSKFSFYIVILGEFLGVLEAAALMLGNEMLTSSLLLCLLTSSLLVLKVLYPVLSERASPLVSSLVSALAILALAPVLKSCFVSTEDDGHIRNLLLSKVTSHRDFHSLLYTCSAEYDFLGWEPVMKMTVTWLLPSAAFVLAFLACHFLASPNKLSCVEPHVVYNVGQMLAFAIMAVFVMRLKLFFTPHLCILVSLIVPNKYFNVINQKEIHFALVAIVVGAMSVTGVKNLREQHQIFGEYSNYALEELLTWVNTSTEASSVFAGSMPITAAILLSTRRPIVNHPHYEDAALRERTKRVYSIYSRKPPEEVHRLLSSLQVQYVVVSENWCVSNYFRGSTCTHVDLWDSEDTANLSRPPTCPLIRHGYQPLFRRVFRNAEYSVLRVLDAELDQDGQPTVEPSHL